MRTVRSNPVVAKEHFDGIADHLRRLAGEHPAEVELCRRLAEIADMAELYGRHHARQPSPVAGVTAGT